MAFTHVPSRLSRCCRLDFERVGIRVYKLSQYEEAVAELGKGAISKAVFEISTGA